MLSAATIESENGIIHRFGLKKQWGCELDDIKAMIRGVINTPLMEGIIIVIAVSYLLIIFVIGANIGTA